jgi:PKD repeat protein
MRNRLIAGGLLAAALSACTVKGTDIPPLTGPSEFALSLAVTAEPDLVVRNGSDTSTVVVVARDHTGAPKSGLRLRVDLVDPADPSRFVDFGTLTSRSITTGADGRATVAYLPPAVPSGTTNADSLIGIVISAVGSDQLGARAATAYIRLVAPQFIHAPGLPFPRFTHAPATPQAGTLVNFSASNSTAESGRTLVNYLWSWGDGATGRGVTEEHDWMMPGRYEVTLTVVDNAGRSASATEIITIAP